MKTTTATQLLPAKSTTPEQQQRRKHSLQPTRPDDLALQKWLRTELEKHHDMRWAAVTLRPKTQTKLEARDSIRKLLRRIHRELFGTSFTKKGRCLVVLCVFEEAEDLSLHCHLMIEVPTDSKCSLNSVLDSMDRAVSHDADFCRGLPSDFYKDHFLSKPHVSRYDANFGWFEYITKPYTKPNYLDALDLTNLQLDQYRTVNRSRARFNVDANTLNQTQS